MYLLFGIVCYGVWTLIPALRKRPMWLLWSIAGFGGLLSTIGAPLVRWKPEFRLFYVPFYDSLANLPKLANETIHANLLAGVLVVVLPVLVGFLVVPGVQRPRLQSLLIAFLALITFIILILTQSRGGYLGVLMSLVILGCLRWPFLGWGVLLLAISIPLIGRWDELLSLMDTLSREDSFGGWVDRLDIWTQSAQAMQDFVFTGIGIGTFTLVIPLLYPLRVPIEGFPHAHNLFLQVGLDLGLPGLIAYLSIIVSCFWMLIHLVRDRSDPLRWSLSIGATSSLTGMLVHGLFDATLWGTKVAFVQWLLFALIVLLHMEQVETNEQPSTLVENSDCSTTILQAPH